MYYTYMIRCSDNSIYTGITTDIQRRFEEHISKGEKCAKYTLKHNAQKLEIAWQSEDRKLASKLEYHIKTLTKAQKEALILSGKVGDFLGNKIEPNAYAVFKDKL